MSAITGKLVWSVYQILSRFYIKWLFNTTLVSIRTTLGAIKQTLSCLKRRKMFESQEQRQVQAVLP